jgi:hypothetical protein
MTVKSKNKLFLDKEELLNLGGRMPHSNIPFREQHPLVLPSKPRYSEMLM